MAGARDMPGAKKSKKFYQGALRGVVINWSNCSNKGEGIYPGFEEPFCLFVAPFSFNPHPAWSPICCFFHPHPTTSRTVSCLPFPFTCTSSVAFRRSFWQCSAVLKQCTDCCSMLQHHWCSWKGVYMCCILLAWCAHEVVMPLQLRLEGSRLILCVCSGGHLMGMRIHWTCPGATWAPA
jgi:hypothetical protein